MIRESNIISYIQTRQKKRSDIVMGIGDDAAILRRVPKGKETVVASDVIVEGTHFKKNQGSPFKWGQKAVLVNVSDFAAMGAIPKTAILGIGLPATIGTRMTHEILDGILSACAEHKIIIVGGDTIKSQKITISVTLIGEVGKGRSITRGGVKKGDVLFLTGPLGRSYPTQHHLEFKPRVKESEYLRKHYDIHGMIDVSDGLMKDLTTLMDASHLGASIRLTAVPLREGASYKNALHDGEDFELLFALSQKDAVKLLSRKLPHGSQFDFYPIGIADREFSKINWFMGEKQIRVQKPKDHHFNA